MIEPIQSRCAIVRFTRLSDEEILSRLLQVCQAEKVTRDVRARCPMRRWTTWLQLDLVCCISDPFASRCVDNECTIVHQNWMNLRTLSAP